MEQNKIIIIALVSALFGGLIGGGVSYYLLEPKINNVYGSIKDLENNLETRTTQIDENIELIKNTINSINANIDQIESQNAGILSNIELIKNNIEQVKDKPTNHLVYIKDYFPKMSTTTSEYPESFKTESFTLKGNVTTIKYHLKIWDSDWGHYVNGIIMLYDETGELITTNSLEAGSSNANFVGEIPVRLNPGAYSIEFKAGIPEVDEYKITSYLITVWDYY